MRFLRRGLSGLFLIFLTLALLVMAGQTLREAVQDRLAREARMPEARERLFSVNVVTAEARDVIPVLTAYGQVQSRRTLEIRAVTGGTVQEIAPEFVEGGSVTEGQVLVHDKHDRQRSIWRTVLASAGRPFSNISLIR